MAALQVHNEDLAGVISIGQSLPVGSPAEAIKSGRAGLGQRLGLTTIVGHLINLFFAAAIADESHQAAIRGKRGGAIMGAAKTGQVAGHAMFHRRTEDVAPGRKQHPLAVGGQVKVFNLLRGVHLPGGAAHKIIGHRDVQQGFSAAGSVEQPHGAGHLVHNLIGAVAAGPFDIPGVVLGDLLGGIGFGVVVIKLQGSVSVGYIVDAPGQPNRIAFSADVGGDLAGTVVSKIVDIQVLRPAALIALPGSKVPKQRRKDDLLAVG